MNALNSLPLWSGLAALGLAVPIIIHLWSRNQKFETSWAAMELLKKALIVRSQKIHVEDYILLVLRCLALLLIAIALLRPIYTATSGSSGSKDVGVVIGIDASYSMNHGEHARFEKAISKTRDILETLSEGDPVSIVLMSQHPQVLFRRTGYDIAIFDKKLNELENASSYSLNLERNLEQLDELVAELKTATRECYIITDAQITDWQGLSDQARTSLDRMGDRARVIVTPVTGSGINNLALTEFAFSAGSLQRDGSARFAANVRNMGGASIDNAAVEFFADGKLKSRQEVGPLAPGEMQSVSFFTTFDTPGDVALSAKLSKDDLLDDNERHAIARIQSSIRVLCIDGDFLEQSLTSPRGAYYLAHALRLKHQGERAPIKVTHIAASDIDREKLSNYDVVVMVNVPGVTEELGKRLHQFTTSGGGLIVYLGDKVDPEQYNKNLASDEYPVLPARLIEAASHDDAGEGWQIATFESKHPLTQLVGRLPSDLISKARFGKAIRVEPTITSEVILKLDGNRLPLLLGHKNESASRVLLFASSADRTWNNLPVHPLFTVLLQQSVTMVSRASQWDHNVVGEAVSVPLLGRMMGDRINVTDPLGSTTPEKATQVDGATVCLITPQVPGVYWVATQAGDETSAVAANVDTAESDVRVADVATFDQWLEGVPVEVLTGKVADSVMNSRTGRDLSLTLLTLGIICFFIQGLLANRFSRRKHAASGDVVASLQGRRVAASRRF
jgi:hypothetical protein